MESFHRGDTDPFELFRLELRETARIGASVGDADLVPEPCAERVEHRIRQCIARIDAVGDVEVACVASVADEGGRAPRHVGAQDGGGLFQPHGPPRAPVASDVGLVGVHFPGPAEKATDLAPRRLVQLVELDRQIDHAAQLCRTAQTLSRVEQLARPGNGGDQGGFRQCARPSAGDPNPVAAGNLPAMDAAKRAQLDLAGWSTALRFESPSGNPNRKNGLDTRITRISGPEGQDAFWNESSP